MSGVVFLRDVCDDDVPIFFEHQRDPEAVRMAAFPARDHDAFLTHWAKCLADETIIRRTIICDGGVAGKIVCWEQEGHRNIGYWLGKEFWGRGIASRALAQFLELVTTRPLRAHAAKHYGASLRVLQKCGFAIVGEAEVSFEGAAVPEFILQLA